MKYRIIKMKAIQHPDDICDVFEPDRDIYVVEKYSGIIFKKWKNVEWCFI